MILHILTNLTNCHVVVFFISDINCTSVNRRKKDPSSVGLPGFLIFPVKGFLQTLKLSTKCAVFAEFLSSCIC